MEFKIPRSPYGRQLYKKSTFQLKNGITVLVGCNGAGKTTFLRYFKDFLDRKDIEYYEYSDIRNGRSNALSEFSFYGDTLAIVNAISASEGENVAQNLGNKTKSILRWIEYNQDKEKWLMLDATDSGLDVTMMEELKNWMHLIAQRGVNIVTAVNNFHLCKGEQCLDILNCKYVDINTYEDFVKIVTKSRKFKDQQIRNYIEKRREKVRNNLEPALQSTLYLSRKLGYTSESAESDLEDLVDLGELEKINTHVLVEAWGEEKIMEIEEYEKAIKDRKKFWSRRSTPSFPLYIRKGCDFELVVNKRKEK